MTAGSGTLANSRWTRYVGAALAIAGGTLLLAPIRAQMNATTVALALLLLVVFVAIFWGSKPALLASMLGMLSFNFFFPSLSHFHDRRSAELGCSCRVLYHGAGRWSAFSQGKTTRGGG